MSEFKLHNLVTELLETLGDENNTPDKITEVLQKNINTENSLVGSNNEHIEHILTNCKNPNEFLLKYEDIKQKNVDGLNSYIQLLYHISQDEGVKNMLNETNVNKTNSKDSELTKDDLASVRNRIKKVVSKKSQFKSNYNNRLSTTTLPVASTSSIASYLQQRPGMSWDFSSSNILSGSVTTIPSVSQENALIDDLLNVLIGISGCFIEAEELKDAYSNRTFKINDNVPLSLREIVRQILPIASHYSIIRRFSEEKSHSEFGLVNNALAEVMEQILADHITCITHLETDFQANNLSLQKLWFAMQKRMHTLDVTANIASSISKSDAKGGKVLNLLHENIIGFIGDEQTQKRCVSLVEAACVPYMKILAMWIYRGIISDPINEFFVEDNELYQKEDMPVDYSADYWDKKYAIRRERIPKFLESVTDIILMTGKYLNVIRQCGKPVKTKFQPIKYKIEDKRYIEAIENAYTFASQTLLDLVLKEKDLIGRLKSVKHYFLLDQGDFIVTFLSLCEKEFNKEVADVVQARIESKMDLALRLSSATSDPYKDDLRTELLPYDLQCQMYRILKDNSNLNDKSNLYNEEKKLLVIDSFSFNYEVHWPLSLILNRKSLACYQMIFRHLFYCKYVERMICQVWKSNKVAKKFQMQDAQHYRNAFALRQRMLHSVQNLEYHMMVEVVEPQWNTFLQKITKVNNVDEILSSHTDFLTNCLKDCMLTIPSILSIIIHLLEICVNFCKFMQRTQRYFVEAELGSLPNSLHESFNQNEQILEEKSETVTDKVISFEEQISMYDKQFSSVLIKLLDHINELNRDSSEHYRLLNLLDSMKGGII